MGRRAVATLAFAGSALLTAVLSASCLDPTQVTLDVSTDVACRDTKGTSFAGGAPGTVENGPPATITNDCDRGHIGTLVSTPSGERDVDAAFVVVLGVDRPSSECSPANAYDGCIVQRRLVRYLPHTPLTLPITMWLVCKGKACDPASTCARNGQCIPARVADPSACEGKGCTLPGDEPFSPADDGGGVDVDGNVADGGGPVDTGVGDGPSPGDASVDGPADGAVGIPATGTFPCPAPGNTSLTCNAPTEACCKKVDGTEHSCAVSCGPATTTMRCNGGASCGVGRACCFQSGAVPVPVPQEAGAALPLQATPTPGSPGSTYCSTTNTCEVYTCLTDAECGAHGLTGCSRTTPYFQPPGLVGVCQ